MKIIDRPLGDRVRGLDAKIAALLDTLESGKALEMPNKADVNRLYNSTYQHLLRSQKRGQFKIRRHGLAIWVEHAK